MTNLRHGMVEVGDLDRLLLEKLDGTHTMATLLDILVHLARSGQIEFRSEAGPHYRRAVFARHSATARAGD